MAKLSTQLLVIGGGATGLGIAWDASLRGVKTVLAEQSDLGQGTSGRYHGLLHSGGRYVITDPQSAIDCARENPILRKIAAPAIEPTNGLFLSTPSDPIDYPDRWFDACHANGVSVTELPLRDVHTREPLLNKRISRAFEVNDAALDSFDLAHMLASGIQEAGGKILLHHRVKGIGLRQNRIAEIELVDTHSGQTLLISPSYVINAAGPWSGVVAALAGVNLPIRLGKGSMLAMANRMTNTVLNRCKPPGDGDIIVPIGTVSVIGTTDVQVTTPEDTTTDAWELDLLLSEADLMLPGIRDRRPLRTWAGVRPLYNPVSTAITSSNRELPRAHTIIDHRDEDGVENFISIFGGKLTTFRFMAEEAVDIIAHKLGNTVPCQTETTILPNTQNRFFKLSDRMKALSLKTHQSNEMMICECELITKDDVEKALDADANPSLDNLRRDLRLGMGPCQAAYCAFRSAGIAATTGRNASELLLDFSKERWKGLRTLPWGSSIRQMELMRRFNFELFNLDMDTP